MQKPSSPDCCRVMLLMQLRTHDAQGRSGQEGTRGRITHDRGVVLRVLRRHCCQQLQLLVAEQALPTATRLYGWAVQWTTHHAPNLHMHTAVQMTSCVVEANVNRMNSNQRLQRTVHTATENRVGHWRADAANCKHTCRGFTAAGCTAAVSVSGFKPDAMASRAAADALLDGCSAAAMASAWAPSSSSTCCSARTRCAKLIAMPECAEQTLTFSHRVACEYAMAEALAGSDQRKVSRLCNNRERLDTCVLIRWASTPCSQQAVHTLAAAAAAASGIAALRRPACRRDARWGRPAALLLQAAARAALVELIARDAAAAAAPATVLMAVPTGPRLKPGQPQQRRVPG